MNDLEHALRASARAVGTSHLLVRGLLIALALVGCGLRPGAGPHPRHAGMPAGTWVIDIDTIVVRGYREWPCSIENLYAWVPPQGSDFSALFGSARHVPPTPSLQDLRRAGLRVCNGPSGWAGTPHDLYGVFRGQVAGDSVILTTARQSERYVLSGIISGDRIRGTIRSQDDSQIGTFEARRVSRRLDFTRARGYLEQGQVIRFQEGVFWRSRCTGWRRRGPCRTASHEPLN